MINRKGIIIYFRNSKVVEKIRKLDINVVYVNKPGKYLAGYVDEDEFFPIKKQLKKNKLIRNVEASLIEMPVINI
jgi:uncharacterized protein YlbG (UPF0298 family)